MASHKEKACLHGLYNFIFSCTYDMGYLMSSPLIGEIIVGTEDLSVYHEWSCMDFFIYKEVACRCKRGIAM